MWGNLLVCYGNFKKSAFLNCKFLLISYLLPEKKIWTRLKIRTLYSVYFFIFTVNSLKLGFGEDLLNTGVIGASLYKDNQEPIQPESVVITFKNKFSQVNITGIFNVQNFTQLMLWIKYSVIYFIHATLMLLLIFNCINISQTVHVYFGIPKLILGVVINVKFWSSQKIGPNVNAAISPILESSWTSMAILAIM